MEHLQRPDLSGLISHSTFEIKEGREDDSWGLRERNTTLIIFSPKPFVEALAVIPHYDRKRIVEALLSDNSSTQKTYSTLADYQSEPSETPPLEGISALLPELTINQQIMIAVATGGKQIQDVNDYFIAREARIREAMKTLGLEYQNPFKDLWDWFRYYKEHFGSYKERRQHINDLYKRAIFSIANRSTFTPTQREPTGWERVDRAIAKVNSLFASAVNEEDFQAVGLLCREILISLGQAVYDPKSHISPDGVAPSSTDASRMLDAYIHHSFSGPSYKEVRGHAKAALNLALNLQHRRTASKQLAALCLEATSSTVATIAILAGRPQTAGKLYKD